MSSRVRPPLFRLTGGGELTGIRQVQSHAGLVLFKGLRLQQHANP